MYEKERAGINTDFALDYEHATKRSNLLQMFHLFRLRSQHATVLRKTRVAGNIRRSADAAETAQ
jgi:hypothetical protein